MRKELQSLRSHIQTSRQTIHQLSPVLGDPQKRERRKKASRQGKDRGEITPVPQTRIQSQRIVPRSRTRIFNDQRKTQNLGVIFRLRGETSKLLHTQGQTKHLRHQWRSHKTRSSRSRKKLTLAPRETTSRRIRAQSHIRHQSRRIIARSRKGKDYATTPRLSKPMTTTTRRYNDSGGITSLDPIVEAAAIHLIMTDPDFRRAYFKNDFEAFFDYHYGWPDKAPFHHKWARGLQGRKNLIFE